MGLLGDLGRVDPVGGDQRDGDEALELVRHPREPRTRHLGRGWYGWQWRGGVGGGREDGGGGAGGRLRWGLGLALRASVWSACMRYEARLGGDGGDPSLMPSYACVEDGDPSPFQRLWVNVRVRARERVEGRDTPSGANSALLAPPYLLACFPLPTY